MSVVRFTLHNMIIDCETCTMRDLACSDCVVSVLLTISDRPNSEISTAEVSAISALSEKGLVPPLRFQA
jgi:hypothetical protein